MFEVFTLPLTPFSQNTRVLAFRTLGQAIVIDPGGESEQVLRFLAKEKLELGQIWLTHSHLDHCGGVAGLLRSKKVTLVGHRAEEQMRSHVEDICRMYGIPSRESGMENCPEPDVFVAGGEELEFGGEKFAVLFTPGHSPGHVCFYHQASKTLFCGDTIFQGSIGRTDLPGGDHNTLIRSIKEKILTLDPQTKLLNGHTADTTVAVEAKTNPFLLG